MPLTRLSRRQAIPLLWWGFCCFCGIPETLCATLWQALRVATWSEAQALHQHLLFQVPYGSEAHTRHLTEVILAPARVLRVLEQLVCEGVLSRQDAAQAEEALLRQLDAQGRWRRPAMALVPACRGAGTR